MKTSRNMTLISLLILLVASCESKDTPPIKIEPAKPTSSDPARVSIDSDLNLIDLKINDATLVKATDGESEQYFVFGANGSWAKSSDLEKWEKLTATGDLDKNGVPNEASDQTIGFSLFAPSKIPRVTSLVENSGFLNQLTKFANQGLLWTSDANHDGIIDNSHINVSSTKIELNSVGFGSPNVIKLASGKYAFYHSHCNAPQEGYCSNFHSYISLSTSNDIDSGYELSHILMQSSESSPGYSGKNWNQLNNPSALDPNVFYDKYKRLWMVYGSYAGGVWIKKLDPNTGLPLDFNSNVRDYGVRLTGGNNALIKSPSIIYCDQTDYYYLFFTAISFDLHDNLNQSLKVARAKNPDGPYFDANEKNISEIYGPENTNNYGTKIIGDVSFTAKEDSSKSLELYSPDNSFVFSPTPQTHYLIFDAYKTNEKKERFLIGNKLAFNAENWPVLIPEDHLRRKNSSTISAKDALGDYKLINQGAKNRSATPKLKYISLLADNSIRGDYTGSFLLIEDKLQLKIDDLGLVEARIQINSNGNVSFGGLSLTGDSILGIKLPDISPDELFQQIRNFLENKIPKEILQFPNLPITVVRGAKITWGSSDNTNFNLDKKVIIRPKFGEKDKSITLYASISSTNGHIRNLKIPLRIKAKSKYNLRSHYTFDHNISDSESTRTAYITGDRINLPPNTEAHFANGIRGSALSLDGTYGLLLDSNTIASELYTISYWIKPKHISPFQPSIFIGATDNFGSFDEGRFLGIYNLIGDWAKTVTVWNRNGSDQKWPFLTTNYKANVAKWQHISLSCNQGKCELFINGELEGRARLGNIFKWKSIIGVGVNLWDQPFEGLIDDLKIYDTALSKDEINALDYAPNGNLNLIDLATNELNSYINEKNLHHLKSNLNLPANGAFGASISWESSNQNILTATGELARTTINKTEETILIARIFLDGKERQVNYLVSVPPIKEPSIISSYLFDGSAIDSKNPAEKAKTTGARLTDNNPNPLAIKFKKGISGQSIYLDGTYGLILNDNLRTKENYAISFWIKPEILTPFSTAIFRYRDGNQWLSFVPNNEKGVFQLWTYSSNKYIEHHFDYKLKPNHWAHAAASIRNNKLSLYLDGRKVNVYTDMPNLFFDNETSIAIGSNFWDKPFRGQIDNLVIYDDELGDAEVTEIINRDITNSLIQN